MPKFNYVKAISPEQKSVLEKLLEHDPGLKVHWDDDTSSATLLAGKLQDPTDSVSDKAAIEFLHGIRLLFKMNDPRRELVSTGMNTDKKGTASVRMQQVYNGIPVEGGSVVVQFAPGGAITWVSSKYIAGVDVDTAPKISPDAAVESLLKSIPDGRNKVAKAVGLSIVYFRDRWQLAHRLWATNADGRSPAQYFVSAADGTVLYGCSMVFNACTPRTDGSGKGVDGVTTPLNTCFDGTNNTYRLVDTTHGARIVICDFGWPYVANGKIKTFSVTDDISHASVDPDNRWDSDGGNAQDDQGNAVRRYCEHQGAEVDLAVNLGKVLDYYEDHYSHQGMDGNGTVVYAGAHDTFFWGCNSCFEPGSKDGLYFGDGDHDDNYYYYDANNNNAAHLCAPGTCPYAPPQDPTKNFYSIARDGKGLRYMTSLDVVAHEFTHGFIYHSANLDHLCPSSSGDPQCHKHPYYTGCGQPNTLHEAIADIFGNIINGDPDMGKNVIIDPVCTCIRTINDPACSDPSGPKARFLSCNHMDATLDTLGTGYLSCTQETNNPGYYNPQKYIGPVVYAAYLLAYGGTHPNSGYSVNGIGNEKLGQILFHAIKMYGQPRMLFVDLYNAMEQSARDLYTGGELVSILNSLTNAFLAVGIIRLVIPPLMPPILMKLICWPWPFPWPWPEYFPVPWEVWPHPDYSPVLVQSPIMPETFNQSVVLASRLVTDRFAGSKDIRVTRVSALGRPGVLRKELVGANVRKDLYTTISARNNSDKSTGFDVDLYVCPADSFVNLSSWTWVDSAHLDVGPKSKGSAEVRISVDKLMNAPKGKVCLIAQYVNSGVARPDGGKVTRLAGHGVFKAEPNFVTYKVMDLQ